MFPFSPFSLVCPSLCLCSTSPSSLLSVCLYVYVLPLPFLSCLSVFMFYLSPFLSVCLYVCLCSPLSPFSLGLSVFMSVFHLSPFSLVGLSLCLCSTSPPSLSLFLSSSVQIMLYVPLPLFRPEARCFARQRRPSIDLHGMSEAISSVVMAIH